MRIRWRGLELPTRVEPDKSVHSDTYGKFIVEPFERGFGTTVGNSLRRILLSSLEGAAPVSVKIAGVEHEFAQIEGVMEDVTDIILNPGDGGEFVGRAFDLDGGNSGAFERAQQHAPQRIADRLAVSGFKRFRNELRVRGRGGAFFAHQAFGHFKTTETNWHG